MDTVIGLLELLAWAACVLALAAAITYSVIKIGKMRDARKEAAAAAGGDDVPAP
jgi:hypothetical protein